MKMCVVPILFLLAAPGFSQVTPEAFRAILKEEIAASEKRMENFVRTEIAASEKRMENFVRTEIAASEKRTREYMDLKIGALDTKFSAQIDGLDKRVNLTAVLVVALIALVVLAIGIPQFMIAYKQRGQDQLLAQIERLNQRIEILEQNR